MFVFVCLQAAGSLPRPHSVLHVQHGESSHTFATTVGRSIRLRLTLGVVIKLLLLLLIIFHIPHQSVAQHAVKQQQAVVEVMSLLKITTAYRKESFQVGIRQL